MYLKCVHTFSFSENYYGSESFNLYSLSFKNPSIFYILTIWYNIFFSLMLPLNLVKSSICQLKLNLWLSDDSVVYLLFAWTVHSFKEYSSIINDIFWLSGGENLGETLYELFCPVMISAIRNLIWCILPSDGFWN